MGLVLEKRQDSIAPQDTIQKTVFFFFKIIFIFNFNSAVNSLNKGMLHLATPSHLVSNIYF